VNTSFYREFGLLKS
jgi:proteasome lid subunit RPN8/RPN11